MDQYVYIYSSLQPINISVSVGRLALGFFEKIKVVLLQGNRHPLHLTTTKVSTHLSCEIREISIVPGVSAETVQPKGQIGQM